MCNYLSCLFEQSRVPDFNIIGSASTLNRHLNNWVLNTISVHNTLNLNDQHNICAQNLKSERHQTATLTLGILLLLPCLFLRSPTDQDRNRKQKACGGPGRVAPKSRCTPHSPSLRSVLCAEPAKGLTPRCPQSGVCVCIAILGTLSCSTKDFQHTLLRQPFSSLPQMHNAL